MNKDLGVVLLKAVLPKITFVVSVFYKKGSDAALMGGIAF
jgi:hypothetical protein